MIKNSISLQSPQKNFPQRQVGGQKGRLHTKGQQWQQQGNRFHKVQRPSCRGKGKATPRMPIKGKGRGRGRYQQEFCGHGQWKSSPWEHSIIFSRLGWKWSRLPPPLERGSSKNQTPLQKIMCRRPCKREPQRNVCIQYLPPSTSLQCPQKGFLWTVSEL